MVVTYYVKLFHKGTDRHNRILMSLLLLVTEKIIPYVTADDIDGVIASLENA